MSDIRDVEESGNKGNRDLKEESYASAENHGAGTKPAATDSDPAGIIGDDQTSAEHEQADAVSIEEDFYLLLKEKDELLAQKHDQLLRTQADFENYKKRMAREREDLLKFGNERLMKELLPILDNFERSLTHAKESSSLEGILEGVDLIRKEMVKTLIKFGLREISTKGERFDPTVHEATAQIPTDDYEEGTVMAEFQKGYFVHDRLLRPAMVAVAGPPPESEGEAEE